MSVDVLKRAGLFIVFALAQAMFLGRIHLFGCATPLLYVYFVILFPRNYPKWAILLWSFSLGLIIDIFFNTPGLAAATMTLLAVVQPYYLEMFVSREDFEELKPTMKNLGVVKYLYYSIVFTLLYCVVFFTLESFSFFDLGEWLRCVIGSTAITLVLILTFESVTSRQQ
jgi:rod shape-determining protein MreD